MAVAYCRYKFVTVSLPNGYVTATLILKPPCGGFRSETATWIKKWFKISDMGFSKNEREPPVHC
jgi:hypothetical protein